MLFAGIFSKLKGAFNRMTGNKTIEKELNMLPIISSEMQNALELWSNMYEDKAPWLREGDYSDPVTVKSLGLPAFIASEKARMVTLEMKSEITAPKPEEPQETEPLTQAAVQQEQGQQQAQNNAINATVPAENTARAEFLNKIYQDKVISKIRQQLEYGIAKGGLVIKPYYVAETPNNTADNSNNNQQTAGNNGLNNNVPRGTLEFDFIQANDFYPLAFNASGDITEAAFIQKKVDKDNIYTRLEHHKLVGNSVIVTNRAYKSAASNMQSNSLNLNGSYLGTEINLTDIPEWAALEPETTIKNVDRLLFAYFKMPEANTIDTHSPLGVSGYSRATKLIEQADKQYSRLLWEFEGGELAIDVDRDALMDELDKNGKPKVIRPQMQQRLFRKIDLGVENTYEVFNPPFRDTALINGLNNILMRIEDVCGLARGTIADVSAEARTATELRILKQRTYASVTDIQTKALQPCLEDLVYIMDVYCTLYNIVGDSAIDPNTGTVNAENIGKYEVSFEWDDSTIVDAETELNKRIVLMQNGISSKVEVRMWYFGETEEQARAALQKIEEENTQSMLMNMQAMQEQGEEQQGEQGKNENNIGEGE